jgi:predicted hotdog family 3-hydroxylacyl-ACP dehydratase
VTHPGGLDRAAIAALIPHAHNMVLLDRAETWDAGSLLCRTRSHLDPANPLRRGGRLATICGIEYGLQATALHGALLAGGNPQAYRFLAALRDVTLQVDRLDDPSLEALEVLVQLQRHEVTGCIYAMQLHGGDGRPVLAARAVIAVPPPA